MSGPTTDNALMANTMRAEIDKIETLTALEERVQALEDMLFEEEDTDDED